MKVAWEVFRDVSWIDLNDWKLSGIVFFFIKMLVYFYKQSNLLPLSVNSQNSLLGKIFSKNYILYFLIEKAEVTDILTLWEM